MADLFPLRSAEVMPRSLPFRRPYVTAKGSLISRETLLLRIRAEDGTFGLGEAVPLSLRGGESVDRVATQLRAWAATAKTAGAAEETFRSTAHENLGPPARCAVETALADLEARRAGLPLHQLLAARTDTGHTPDLTEGPAATLCNATLTTGDPDEVRAQAERWAVDGFTVFKLKLGPEGDRGQVAAVRDSLGSEVKIRLDVNGSWSVEQAERELRRLEELDLELVEQPVPSLEEMARLREVVSVPLVADESVNDETEACRAAKLGACEAATVKLSKIGTLDPSLGGHLPTYLSSALDGPIGIAAAAHVAAARRRVAPQDGWGEIAQGLATQRLFEPEVNAGGSGLDGPWLYPPTGPGLGIDPDLP